MFIFIFKDSWLSHFSWTFFAADKIETSFFFLSADHEYRNKKAQFCGCQKIFTKTTTSYCNNIGVNDKWISQSTV